MQRAGWNFGVWLIFAGMAVVAAGSLASIIWRRRDLSLWSWLWLYGQLWRSQPERTLRPERVRAVLLILDIGFWLVVAGAAVALAAGLVGR
jgi:hypothetical protein